MGLLKFNTWRGNYDKHFKYKPCHTPVSGFIGLSSSIAVNLFFSAYYLCHTHAVPCEVSETKLSVKSLHTKHETNRFARSVRNKVCPLPPYYCQTVLTDNDHSRVRQAVYIFISVKISGSLYVCDHCCLLPTSA